MKKLIIKSLKHGEMTRNFETELEVQEFIQASGDHYGKLAYPETIPAKDAVLDENGVEVMPAIEEQVIQHEATVSYEVEDITAVVEREKINKDSLEYLAKTDWYVVRFSETGEVIPEDIKQKRQQARQSIVR